jgi:flagellin
MDSLSPRTADTPRENKFRRNEIMRINHNIAALNANNRLKLNDTAISKNLQKLASGYRINSAADDAAGLAVSEKMRAQINGLNQAIDNAENGISLIQTAEGGLNETESILQRMNTLAVESANGTYQDETDRANLNKEIEALKSEIDRISTSTNFNQINLLDGSLVM